MKQKAWKKKKKGKLRMKNMKNSHCNGAGKGSHKKR